MTSTFIKCGVIFYSLVCSFMAKAAEDGERELRDLTQAHRTQVRQIQDEMVALAREGVNQAENEPERARMQKLEQQLTDLSLRLSREDEDICGRFSALLLEEIAQRREATFRKEIERITREEQETRFRDVLAEHRRSHEEFAKIQEMRLAAQQESHERILAGQHQVHEESRYLSDRAAQMQQAELSRAHAQIDTLIARHGQ
jgi:hypothetical protein